MTSSSRVRVLAGLNVAVLVFALVAGVATVADEEPGSPTVASLALDGTAEVEGVGGTQRLEAGDHRLAVGDRVRVLTGGAVLALGDDGALELRGRSGSVDGSRVEIGTVPSLLDGDVLLIAGATERVVEAGSARLGLVDGAAHVSRSTGTTFAVYAGRATLSSSGRLLDGGLPALRQVVVSDAGMLPLSPSPLRVSEPPDPWERRFLSEAIGLDSVLEQRSIGFTTLLQDDFVPDVFFYQAVLPGLLQEPDFDQSVLEGQDRPVGETLVGATIALVGEGGDFAGRWQQVFDLRAEGAGWGIIALDQGAPRADLQGALDEAVARSPLLFGPPSPSPVFRPVPAPVRTRPPSVPLAPMPSLPPRRTPEGPPPPAVSPPPAPPVVVPNAPDDDGVLDPVVDPLADLLEGVLDGLGGVTDSLL